MRRSFSVCGLLVACGASVPPPRIPTPGTPPSALAPGARAAGGSLFGTDVIGLPTGAALTPDAAPGSRLYALDPHLPEAPGFRAGNAVASALAPDGNTLVVLTSGFNRVYVPGTKGDLAVSSEYLFVYDVSRGAPREVDVVPIPNAFGGVAFAPTGDRIYVSGGSDDALYELARDPASGRFVPRTPAIPLGHLDAKGYGGLGLKQSPYAAGVAVTASGARVLVTNHENDTLSVVDTRTRSVGAEVKLAPGAGRPGGEFPAGVVALGEDRALVACQRDREVAVVDLAHGAVTQRIPVGGQPTKIIVNRAGTRAYVANANSDSVSVIDLGRYAVVEEISTALAPGAKAALRELRGSNPNALALAPDERTLYVTNGGTSTLAMIALEENGNRGRVLGLVPTGFYPHAVSVSKDGSYLFVAHGKSPTGPNPGGPWSDKTQGYRSVDPGAGNQYAPQLTHGGLLALPKPAGDVLARLTAQSLLNNRQAERADDVPKIFSELRGKVKHVVYVIGENRTFDQLFADIPGADGEPRLLMWGEAISPNQHQLARSFATLDRFFDAGGVSGDGWQWTMSGRTTDVAEKAIPVEYAARGHHTYDWEGANRDINVGLSTIAERVAWNPLTPKDPDLLPGTADVGAVDGPEQGGRGFLWDAALARGLSVRNYGVFCEDIRYGLPANDPARVPPIAAPWETGTRVAFPTKAALAKVTDPYFRGFDMNYADTRRVLAWEREFDQFVAKGELPALELVRLPHDHFGNFATAEDGLSTPDQQMADHDYAIGRLVERISTSPFWESTVVVVVEDDAQNGADHVDAHRSLALFAGGHVKRGGAIVRTTYSTPSVLRTIELLLGMAPLGQADAFAPPIGEVFDTKVDTKPVRAIVPAVLRSTQLPLPAPGPNERAAFPRGDGASWALLTRGMDFRHEDSLPTEQFNRALACGTGVAAAGCASEALPVASKGDTDHDDDD